MLSCGEARVLLLSTTYALEHFTWLRATEPLIEGGKVSQGKARVALKAEPVPP
jgi:hypothetical protein